MTETVTRPPARRRLAMLAAVVLLLLAAQALPLEAGLPAVSQSSTVTALRATGDPGLDPWSGMWGRVAGVEVPLTAQKVTYPQGGGGLEPPVAVVRAVHFKDRIFVRMEWDDTTKDDSTVRPQDFADGAAIEFPGEAAATVPYYCMGQADSGVNIWQWRADSQAGFPTYPKQVFPNAYVDVWQKGNDHYYTARDAGNPYAVRTKDPVQNLVALGFGTLGPAKRQPVTGRGVYNDAKERWAVVFTRSFASPGKGQPGFTADAATDVALAAWNGANGDRNGQKTISQFMKLEFSESRVPASHLGLVIGLLVLVTVVAVAIVIALSRMSAHVTGDAGSGETAA